MRSFFLLVLVLPFACFAQKKLTPASRTDLMGLELPQGSKKDSRSISISAANLLFGTESKTAGCTSSKTEVYLIPVETYSKESLKTVLTSAGYTFTPLASDDKMALASGKGKSFIIYYAKEAGWSDLYIAECTPTSSTQSSPVSMPAAPGNNSSQPSTPSGSNLKGSFQFTSSNFDDGWTAQIEKDWVSVNKGGAQVYLYYVLPYNSDEFSGTGVRDRDYYWDKYVAPRFSITEKRYRDDGEFVSSLQPKYVEGKGADPGTGQSRFIAMTLAVSPNAAMITVASYPDEASFRQQFPRANDKFVSDLANMNRYNKFGIGAADLIGTWQSGGTQMTQWYDAVTGSYAGATLAASSASFTFMGSGQYESIHNGATGAVGAMNSFQQEYRGSYTVSNWSVMATNRYQGKTEKFDAHFQAVRGGRLLFLNDNKGGSYLLVKIK